MTGHKSLNDQTTVGAESLDATRVLTVVEPGRSREMSLPASAVYRVGRDSACELVIEHPSVSRQHLRLTISESVTVEDLGSANGSFIGNEQLEAGKVYPVASGQTIRVGDVLLVIGPGGRSRVLPHQFFLGTLDAECKRATDERDSFLCLYLPPPVDEDLCIRAFSPLLRERDRMGRNDDDGILVFLTELGLAEAASMTRRLRTRLEQMGYQGQITYSVFPHDGHTAIELIEAAESPSLVLAESTTPVVLDASMQEIYDTLARAASTKLSVLLLGESGVGKEVLARTLHRRSPRRDAPFVALNCAALPEQIVESELFGHAKGAFTGAVRDKQGLFRAAHGGTLFLDEIGDMPAAIQAKLLRVLEDRKVRPIGGSTEYEVDVQVVAATNANLEKQIAAGSFRSDLYYRLSAVVVTIPPLRERPSEIVPLAEQFLAQLAEEHHLARPPVLTETAKHELLGQSWPGNIRELRNSIERALVLGDGDTIERKDILPISNRPEQKPTTPQLADTNDIDLIRRTFERCGGNRSQTARLLGISRRTLSRRLAEHGIDED